MPVLLHGTTRRRAEQIQKDGPSSSFVEPGGSRVAESFCTNLESGPFLFGSPEEYACAKAADFPDEGGAAIRAIDVPDEMIALAVNEWFPVNQGLVQFDEGAGLEELVSAWSTLRTEIRSVECP